VSEEKKGLLAAPRCGDTVFHRPSKETWCVSYADQERDELSWVGWPEGYAKLSDCDLVQRCSDEDHVAAVREWLEKPHRRDSGFEDRRVSQVSRLYRRALPMDRMLPLEAAAFEARVDAALQSAQAAAECIRGRFRVGDFVEVDDDLVVVERDALGVLNQVCSGLQTVLAAHRGRNNETMRLADELLQ
jgi:hypothetical protein